jgi:hypothetical protein
VINNPETRGNQIFDTCHTFFQVKDGMAFSAVEVVMMTPIGALISGWLSWDFNAARKPLFLEGLKSAIDCGDSERGDDIQCKPMNLIG